MRCVTQLLRPRMRPILSSLAIPQFKNNKPFFKIKSWVVTLNLAMSQIVLPKTYFSTGTFFLSKNTSALTYATINHITRPNYSVNTVFEQLISSPDPV
jgi:hypothetical protein